LSDNGFYVDTYNDPVKALARFKPQFYDLVFIDIRMPRLNGFQFFRRLRKKDHHVKVCFITAFQSYYDSLKQEHPGLNAKCFIRKPIDTQQLLSTVRSELKIVE
jgi:DNA-binding response OmpR family regulator